MNSKPLVLVLVFFVLFLAFMLGYGVVVCDSMTVEQLKQNSPRNFCGTQPSPFNRTVKK